MKNQSFIKRLGFALNGIKRTIHSEASFKFQLAAAVFAILVLAFSGASAQWWAIFIVMIGSVLSAELFNTALEHLSDHLHPQFHDSIKLAKDCAAGAVLVLSLVSIIVFVCFVIERLL